jgi:hypothetical protein
MKRWLARTYSAQKNGFCKDFTLWHCYVFGSQRAHKGLSMLKYVIEQGLWTWSSRNKEMSLTLKTRHIRGNNFRDHVKLKIIGAENYANCSSELGMQQPLLPKTCEGQSFDCVE